MSPFAIKGRVVTLSLTRASASRSARPPYISARVLPCIHIAAAPPRTAASAHSVAFILSRLIPSRIFTVTGRSVAPLTALTMRSISSGLAISAEPSPFENILFTGQPIFISIATGRTPSVGCDSLAAAAAMISGSEPKICTATLPSSGSMRASSKVFLSPKVVAFALTISVTVYSAPSPLHTSRIARSV